MNKWTQYIYYWMIALLSMIMLAFLPMLGTEVGLQWNAPNTKAGWIVWTISKLSSAGFNVMLFHCFNLQGKQNIRTHENYLKAKAILLSAEGNLTVKPRSPKEYNADIYSKKGITIFVTTLLGLIGLGQAILVFDPLQFIIQLVSLAVGLIFGFLQMKSTEEYYTQEFLDYANKVKEECEHVHDRRKDFSESAGTGAGEQKAN